MDFSKFVINKNATIREAFKKEDSNGEKFVLVEDERHIICGIITNGDFRRAIWNSVSLEDPVTEILNEKFISVEPNTSRERLKKLFVENKNVRQIPILQNGKLVNIVFRNMFKFSKRETPSRRLSTAVVIMAGGRGTRLDPFTRILPKPLIPIGDKAVIEIILTEFAKFGLTEFYISVNEKAKMIRAYFEELDSSHTIQFIDEAKPLGTAGALAKLRGQLKKPFFVSNCDIIIDADYGEFYEFHKKGKFDLSLISSMQHHVIPYGICMMNKHGILERIDEKPEYDFLVNTGMYILNPEILAMIPEDKIFHMTDLINEIQARNGKIGVFPISSNSWIDVGQWEEYKKSLEKLNQVL